MSKKSDDKKKKDADEAKKSEVKKTEDAKVKKENAVVKYSFQEFRDSLGKIDRLTAAGMVHEFNNQKMSRDAWLDCLAEFGKREMR